MQFKDRGKSKKFVPKFVPIYMNKLKKGGKPPCTPLCRFLVWVSVFSLCEKNAFGYPSAHEQNKKTDNISRQAGNAALIYYRIFTSEKSAFQNTKSCLFYFARGRSDNTPRTRKRHTPLTPRKQGYRIPSPTPPVGRGKTKYKSILKKLY